MQNSLKIDWTCAMKQYFLPTFFIFLNIFKPTLCMQKDFALHKERNLCRWSQLMYIQALMEPNLLVQQDLFNQAHTLATTKDLRKKIERSKKFALKSYAADAKKALLSKLIAQQLVKEAKRKNKELAHKKAELSKSKQRKIVRQDYIRLIEEKNRLLDLAQKEYIAAAMIYLLVYDNAQKRRYLSYAEDIVKEKIYEIEIERMSTSSIFTLYDEINLFKEIQKRKGN